MADWWGPEVITRAPLGCVETVAAAGDLEQGLLLCANGGGKDSFLVLKTLEAAGVPIAAFHQARSEYGRLTVHDDITDGEFLSVYAPRMRGDVVREYPCQVGSPEMIFNALPLVLAYGYAGIVMITGGPAGRSDRVRLTTAGKQSVSRGS